MKNVLIIVLSLIILICCSGCGNEKTNTPAGTPSPSPVDSGRIENPTLPDGTETKEDPEPPAGEIDVDLTKMNSTMVYNEVYDMVNDPEKYMGKTIKMSGVFNASYYEPTDNYYYYVVIADATACCAQGIEFVWEGDHKYPDDYPKNGDEVIVTGVYGQYDELGITYNYILTDGIEVVNA